MASYWKKSVPPKDDTYWLHIREKARRLNADGCTGVPDFYLDACLEHDIHYRTHQWLDEEPIFKSEADARFRQVIQSRSIFGLFSPMALWRWVGVMVFGKKAWSRSVT